MPGWPDFASGLTEGPNQVSRENGRRRIVVTANARERDIASVVAVTQARMEAEVLLPSGYFITWGGQFENLEAARQRLMVVVPALFFQIFLLLYTAFGSPRDVLLVFSAVSLALTGGIATLWLRGNPAAIPAQVKLYKNRLSSNDQAFVQPQGPAADMLRRLLKGPVKPKDIKEARVIAQALQGLPRPLTVDPAVLRILLAQCLALIVKGNDSIAKTAIRKAIARLDEVIS